MSDPLVLAYLTSAYARASDSFVRGEVRELRALGHSVHTFSVRKPAPHEVVGEDARKEHGRTTYLLPEGPWRLSLAAVRWALRDPRRFAQAAFLAARIGTPGARGRTWPFAYLVEAAYLAERLLSLGVQHLHAHIAEGPASVAMLASELSGVPFSVTVHGPGEFDQPAALALERKLERAAFFVAISEFTRGQLLRWTRPEDWSEIHVVRCGVEPSLLQHRPVPLPTEPRLVSVGRLDVQKGQLVLLEALADLAAGEIDAQLLLVGDGPLRASLEAAVCRLGLEGRVQFAGWLPPTEVVAAVERSRALVMASLAEGLPVVAMEALALQRPVVATNVAALSELIEPGVCGWLVPPGSVQALSRALREVLDAPTEELARMGKAGAVRVRERHDASQEARRLESLFRQSIEHGAKA